MVWYGVDGVLAGNMNQCVIDLLFCRHAARQGPWQNQKAGTGRGTPALLHAGAVSYGHGVAQTRTQK
jgi:hypothetical protein